MNQRILLVEDDPDTVEALSIRLKASGFTGEESNEHYHWYFEIIPKLSEVAGFKWGSGCYINPTPPEEAAAFLREITATTKKQPQVKR